MIFSRSRHPFVLLRIFILAAVFGWPAAPLLAGDAAALSPHNNSGANIFAGGVAGVEDLAVADNSALFRAAGGGVYLHNNGWGALTPAQRRQVVVIFSNAPVAMELGFGGSSSGARAWALACQRNYLALGIAPQFIAANAFANNNHPTAEQWLGYMAALRAAGVSAKTLILPTFEYQNFAPNRATLAQCVVSRQPVFQAIIRAAGGIVLDTPPGFFFAREPAYRDWVVDAIRWTQAQGCKTIVIVSPHSSKNNFAEHSRRFLDYLRGHQAVPDIFAVENYNPKPSADYPNRVGNENQINTALGVARMLQLKTK